MYESNFITVYHVTTAKKLKHYKDVGYIKSPIRAWLNIKHAVEFASKTGRSIIILLRFPKECKELEGHKGNARVIYKDYDARVI